MRVGAPSGALEQNGAYSGGVPHRWIGTSSDLLAVMDVLSPGRLLHSMRWSTTPARGRWRLSPADGQWRLELIGARGGIRLAV